MVIRHTNRGHFRHFKVASRSLPFCAPSSSKIWFPVSLKTKGSSARSRGRERRRTRRRKQHKKRERQRGGRAARWELPTDRTLWIIFNQRRGSEGGTGAGWPLGRSTLMAAVTIFQVSNRVDQTILKHFCGVHVV